MPIRQFQVAHDATQDRLVLRAISDQAKGELALADPTEPAGSPLGVAGDRELPPPVPRLDKSRRH